jgi:D-alanine-D-alanine ligase
VSLKTGGAVLQHLPRDKYHPVDILLTKDGTWHTNGIPTDIPTLAKKVDIVFNALHGEYGEDGKVQRLFDNFSIPYTGSGALSSAIGMNKSLSKERYKMAGLRTAPHIVIDGARIQQDVHSPHAFQKLVFDILERIPTPFVAKPICGGSSVGTYIVREDMELADVLLKLALSDWDIMFEGFVAGKEATCGVVDNFRGEEHYTLLPIEIRPIASRPFFDYEAKYNGGSEEICPGNFSRQESRTIQNMAKLAHKTLGLRHYSRSDFIVTPRGIYILETNTLPGLTEQSLIPKSLNAIGSSLPEFLDHIITLAMNRS